MHPATATATATATAVCSPAYIPLSRTSHLSSPPRFPTFKKTNWGSAIVLFPANCSRRPTPETSDEAETTSNLSSSSGSLWGSSTYSWCAGLGGLGFLETSYLTYLKFSNSDAFCPINGGSCTDILNSDYSFVFGVPLSLIGMIAYGFVLVLGLQLAGKNLPFKLSETDGRLLLLSTTTSLAAASSYFLYILSTKFAGSSCLYCLASAVLSFSLLLITLKDFTLQDIQKAVALPVCAAAIVIVTLSTSYVSPQPVSPNSVDVETPHYTTEVTTESSPLAISLARHLHSKGAKMYGAFWCSHCFEQKEMFGREAAKLLDYVECFPEGYKKGVKLAKACSDVGIDGFPTWVIDGQVLSGEQELGELARISGFDMDEFNQP